MFVILKSAEAELRNISILVYRKSKDEYFSHYTTYKKAEDYMEY